MKKNIITMLIALVAFTASAQDNLIRINDTEKVKDVELSFHEHEMVRLLMPSHAEFGVVCVPSFTPEWTMAYDSVAHVLVLKESEESIWYKKYHFTHWNEHTHEKGVKRPKKYKSPKVKTHKLAITSEQAQTLHTLWREAISQAEDEKVIVLDGVMWKFFIDGRCAKSHSEKNALVQLTNGLKEAVRDGDKRRRDSLLAEHLNDVTKIQH